MIQLQLEIVKQMFPLFKAIKNNIAVSNSTENLKKLAKIITTKKSGEGVLEGLDMITSDFR